MTDSVQVHAPETEGFGDFDVKAFMGKWHVTHSTLPLWRNKKDVKITYTPIDDDPLRFHDVVEYRSEDTSSSRVMHIKGTDTLVSAKGAPKACFQWRGKGLLMFTTSKWHVLGHGEGWALTYFEKTLFTPAGLDIYSRDEAGIPQELAATIVSRAQSVGGIVGKLAEQLFRVNTSLKFD